MRFLLFSSLFILSVACTNNPDRVPRIGKNLTHRTKDSIHTKQPLKAEDPRVRRHFEELGLVPVSEYAPDIRIDLRYSTDNNFMGMQLYDYIQTAYLQQDVAERLAKAQQQLEALKPGFHLVIFDAVRPRNVQQKMWDALDSIPAWKRGKFVSNPAHGSVHNYGAAVDVSILDSTGNLLDMGAGYDDIREIAYPEKEAFYLAKGMLTQQQVDNRKLLRKVMNGQGFRNIPTEWWHFNACSRNEARRKYPALESEI